VHIQDGQSLLGSRQPVMNQKRNKGSKKTPSIRANPRSAQSSTALGTLVGSAVNVAKSIPIIGTVVDKAETVASSILSFLGLGSSLYEVHYASNGRRFLRPHSHVALVDGFHQANSAVAPGSILLRYEISIGPNGSRSRRMGENFEKYDITQFQLAITAVCAATEPGQLAYVFVPDPLDRTLDTMDSSSRLEAILGRDSVQLAQIWQNTVLNFQLPRRQFFVQPEAGDIRFASPGAVYVIAVTSLDSTKLPTLRQTSALSFTRATSAPSSASVQIGRSTVFYGLTGSRTVDLANYAGDSGTADDIHAFDSSRIVKGNTYSASAGGSLTNPDVIRVYAGEELIVALSANKDHQVTSTTLVKFTSDFVTFVTFNARLGSAVQPSSAEGYSSMPVYYLTAPADGYITFDPIVILMDDGNDVAPQLTALFAIYPSRGNSLPNHSYEPSVGLRASRHGDLIRCPIPLPMTIPLERHLEEKEAVAPKPTLAALPLEPNQPGRLVVLPSNEQKDIPLAPETSRSLQSFRASSAKRI